MALYKYILLGVGLAAALAAAGAVSRAAAGEAAAGPAAKAPPFALEDHNGAKVALADLAGKTVVLEWVNFDCPFVKRHYKSGTFKALAAKYKDQGVVWLAVNSTHYADREKNRAFAEAEKVPYPILDDRSGDVGRAYGAKTTPHLFIIDKGGAIVYRGAIDDDPDGKKDARVNYTDQALGEVLAGKAVSAPETKPYGCSVKYAPAK